MGPKSNRLVLVVLSVWWLVTCSPQFKLVEAVDGNLQSAGDVLTRVKTLSFIDPNTSVLYQVSSYNYTTIHADTNQRSVIKINRVKINEITGAPVSGPENIQTLQFRASLVDFDIHCVPTHCYLVAVTSRTRRNVELYAWTRTQFDLLATRDSFARPHAVKIFRIQSGFYVAVAQDQSHLAPFRLVSQNDYDEPTRFIGCALFKFFKGKEQSIKYHQFIRLTFNPSLVQHYTSITNVNATGNVPAKPHEANYLVFTRDQNWYETRPFVEEYMSSYVWSPLDDQFWPYRLPASVKITSRPNAVHPVIEFPGAIHQPLPIVAGNLTTTRPYDNMEAVEICFGQLQRLLAEREVKARRLIESSGSLWRAPYQQQLDNTRALTNISAQVIVYGNVIVRGSMIESPQITLMGYRGSRGPQPNELNTLVSSHSPVIVENKLKKALLRLQHVRDKLSHAHVVSQQATFNSKIRFFSGLQAERVVFANGVSNSNMRLNSIPFLQLEHELVSLRRSQDIAGKVIFNGSVTADLLEIHGQINRNYYLADAVDITSPRTQIIQVARNSEPQAGLEFDSVAVGQLILSHNATFNDIRLDDFITRDNRQQVVHGRKTFKYLSMGQLELAHPGVLLNGFDIARLATRAIRLREQKQQFLTGQHVTFSKPITVGRLQVDNLVNGRVDISALIQDSVKTNDVSQQQISGHKNFLSGLAINRLTTDGAVNGIAINQVFNLNPEPPTSDYARFGQNATLASQANLITGNFVFAGPVTVRGNFNTALLNDIDISRRAARRWTRNDQPLAPQPISGLKTFWKPLRVVNSLKMLYDQRSVNALAPGRPYTYPLVNRYDLRLIQDSIKRNALNPPPININTLEIAGNLEVLSGWNQSFPASTTTFGNNSLCPLDVLRNRVVLGGDSDQTVDVPVQVESLRAKHVFLDLPGALNGFNFPSDFVLRNPDPNRPFEPIYGSKSFEHLVLTPGPSTSELNRSQQQQQIQSNQFVYSPVTPLSPNVGPQPNNVVFGPRASINMITYNQLQTFLDYERNLNTTGETVLQTLTVHGNIIAKHINGQQWPEGILLKSVTGTPGYQPSPHFHRRIYSPLVFTPQSQLIVDNQLVLRGPVQLAGRLNDVNLTEFARQSVTFGDKDLLSGGRPLRNKIFMGGIGVGGELRSWGRIDGIDFEEMRHRVVTIGPQSNRKSITSPKVFLSDVNFDAPVTMHHLGDLAIDNYLRRIKIDQNGVIRIVGKKTVTGALRINKNLIVDGLINGIDFGDLKSRAITLAPTAEPLQFNKTLTIEGDAYIDNLLIDQNNGIIDGVKLINLLPVDNIDQNELIISSPVLAQMNTTYGPQMVLRGQIQDCNITCNLDNPLAPRPSQPIEILRQPIPQAQPGPPMSLPMLINPQYRRPVKRQLDEPASANGAQRVTYPPRMINYQGRNVSYLRSTPPYTVDTPAWPGNMATSPSPPMPYQQQPHSQDDSIRNNRIRSLAVRQPVAINYESPAPNRISTWPQLSEAGPLVTQQLNWLRSQMVSLQLVGLKPANRLVLGFIDSPLVDMASLYLADSDSSYVDTDTVVPGLSSFVQLDQVDVPFTFTKYHLRVGIGSAGTANKNQYPPDNTTQVLMSINSNEAHKLPALPVEYPNTAMFLKVPEAQSLMLLVSQDDSVPTRNGNPLCPRYESGNRYPVYGDLAYGLPRPQVTKLASGGIHIYVFQRLLNSSSIMSSYFEPFQTIDLPAIDRLEKFNYNHSTYVLAVSRAIGRVYLLLYRGYSGLQIVSHVDAPQVDYVRVAYGQDQRPVLVIYQVNGLHRFMESVII